MNNKIFITLFLIVGLMALIFTAGLLLVLFFAWDVTKGSDGILSLPAFIIAAFILGFVTDKVINRIKRVWE